MLEAEPIVKNIKVNESTLVVSLGDGRELTIPLSWYPRLQHGSEQERNNWRILGGGYAVEWPELDEHIGIEGLLAGRRSGESQKSYEKWLAARA